MARRWGAHLSLDLVCAASGQETTDDKVLLASPQVTGDIVFGLKLAEITAQQGPSIPLQFNTLRHGIVRAATLSMELWREIADRVRTP